MNENQTITIEEFMVRRLGGEASVFSEYLREVADLNRAGGSRRTLGEIIHVAEEHGCKDWLMKLTLPEISGYFFVEPDKTANKYCRRTKAQIEETRKQILTILASAPEGKTAASLADHLDIDPKELRRKDLPWMKRSGLIVSQGTGDDAVYMLAAKEEDIEIQANWAEEDEKVELVEL